jgi:hypothetical protein
VSDNIQDLRVAPEFEPTRPLPLRRTIPPEMAFPVACLGEELQGVVEALQHVIQAPMAICAQTVLAGVNFATQGLSDVGLPMGIVRPISEFFVTIAESGERKSAADDLALSEVRRYQRELDTEHKERMNEYLVEKQLYDERLRAKIKSASKSDHKPVVPGPAPEKPLNPTRLVSEPTYEGLVKLMQEGLPSIGLFSDEGGRMIGGYGMSEDQRLKTAAGLSELWDGKPISRVRAGDGSFTLYGRRLSSHLMVQPMVSNLLFGDLMLSDQGLLSRILPALPARAAGSRFYRPTSPETDRMLTKLGARLRELLVRDLPLAAGTTNELDPPVMSMSSGARKLWIEFADSVERQLGEGRGLDEIKGFANKMPEHATRLAASLQLFTDVAPRKLEVEWLARGIELAQHYAQEWMRIRAQSVSVELEQAQNLLGWLHGREISLISLPDIYQRGPKNLRSKDEALASVKVLDSHGWLIPVPEGDTIDGQFRRDVWRIVRPAQ